MSLIAMQKLHAGRPLARTLLLLLIALASAIIVGLLAMHSLDAHTEQPGHPTAMSVAMSSGADPAHATASDARAAAPAATDTCADCSPSHPDMMAMSCVLALVAVALLLVRPRRTRRWLAQPPRWEPRAAPLPGGDDGVRPPSLTALCISRT